MKQYIAYVDGGCPGNGRSADQMFGSYLVYDVTGIPPDKIDHDDLWEQEPFVENLRFTIAKMPDIPKVTNNVAEILSLYLLLTELLKRNIASPDDQIIIYCDSELVVNQMIGAYKVKHQHLRKAYKLITRLFDQYSEKHGASMWDVVTLQWISGQTMKETRIGH